MSVRFLIASFVSGVLLLATGSFLAAGETKMITKVYPVADLVIPLVGNGNISYYPLGLAVVVTQTPEVQEQVAELLKALRRLQDTEVSLEVRFVTITDKCFARVAQNLGIEAKLQNAGLKNESYEPGL